MKITPLEIRQKTFEKKLRGLDKDEVTAFLLSLSQEWEQVQDEVKELRLRNDTAEKEIKQLREVENSLFKTLKTAEDTGANMIDQATKTAELHLRETQMSADALLNEAKTKARATIDEAETKARLILDKMGEEMQSLKMEYRSLENLRDIIIAELKNLSNDTLTRVEKIETKAAQDAQVVKTRLAKLKEEEIKREESAPEPLVESHVDETKDVTVEVEQAAEEIEADTGIDKALPDEPEEELQSTAEEISDIPETENTDADEESSFFDQIK